MSHVFKRLKHKADLKDSNKSLWHQRAKAIYEGLHVKQRRPIDSILEGLKYISICTPRRAGKSFDDTSVGLWFGEEHPGSRILIISLTLKSTIDNFWSSAPGGLFVQNDRYGLNLKFNHTRFSWQHENGSRGQLVGAETISDIEKIRGALAEADVAIVDECKSFAPELLTQLIRDVLKPGLMTRNGVLILSGTPGSIPVGPFYEATSTSARTEYKCVRCDREHPTCIPWGEDNDILYSCLSAKAKRNLFRLHTWTIQDNTSSPGAWQRALDDKESAQWPDDHPTWRREFLGQWVTDASELVYAWAQYKDKGQVTWHPTRSKKNPSGLPEDLGPWRFVLGIDLGFVDDSALVLAAYSETRRELRHVYDYKAPGMTIDAFMDQLFEVIERFGRPDAIVADSGGGGSKMLIETINQRYGLGVESAKKMEKQDHIELLNSDFASGRIKIIPGSDLAMELSGLQWDLSKESKIILARTGRLKEDPQCPNHLCDALLYLYRFSYHFWSETLVHGPEPHTAEWWRLKEEEAIKRVSARKHGGSSDPHGLRAYAAGRNPLRSGNN